MKREFIIAVLVAIGFSACNQTQETLEGSDEIMEELAGEKATISGEEIQYSSDTVTMNGYIVHSTEGKEKKPGILVIHEWWGHTDYVRNRADMLASLGYTAMAVDMYGDGKTADHPDKAKEFSSMVMSNMDEATGRFNSALATLKNHPMVDSSNIAVIGYCFGGSVALTMANAGADLDAVAAFHSGVQLPVMPGEDLKARVLVCNGADDPMITDEQVAAFTSAMDSVGADYEYIEYKGAVHAFTNPQATEKGEKFNLPLAYHKEADERSWEELKSFLEETFN